jgi:hypothetical protein
VLGTSTRLYTSISTRGEVRFSQLLPSLRAEKSSIKISKNRVTTTLHMLTEFFAASLALLLAFTMLELLSPSKPEKRDELTPSYLKLPDIGTH